jgi:hypothetical protein
MLFYLHARLRARRAPGIPCALCLEGKEIWQTSGASRREIAKLCFVNGARLTPPALREEVKKPEPRWNTVQSNIFRSATAES